MTDWTTSSPLHGRLLLLRGAMARSRAAEVAGTSGFTGRSVPAGLGGAAAAWLAGFDMGGGRAGLSALVDEPTFRAALRSLTDAPYLHAAAAAGAGRVVDVVEDAAAEEVARRIYPDALVVDADQPVPALPVLDPVQLPSPAESDLGRGLVVVVGSGRSGTTWLHRLLTAHPLVTGTEDGETWMFRGAGGFWRAHRDAGTGGPAAWLGEDDLVAAIRRCCDELIEAGRRRLRPGATHLVEKTPAHVWALPLLARLYPQAAYLHVLRDGRDVALSLSRVEGAYDGPGSAAAAWASAVRAVRATAPQLPRYAEVRYEELLAAPVEVAGRLLSWVGVEPDDAFRRTAAERAGERVSPLPSQGRVGAGKWRDLEPASLAAVEAAAGDLLVELGYA